MSQRPRKIRKRGTFGHWELNTVVSSQGKSTACVATFIDWKTRMYLGIVTIRGELCLEKALHSVVTLKYDDVV